jgi:short-subunit dehydrogenase
MTILILGATSAIAQAYARRRAAGTAFVLAGRREDRLAAIAADLVASGAKSADTLVLDLAALDAIEEHTKAFRARYGDVEEIVIAYGVLGEQAASERDLPTARAIVENNYVSPMLWILALLRDRPPMAPLNLVAIGSVAGDRGRASNFIYGSAKAGLDRVLEGLTQKYDGTPVRIITVKPGFVDTPMTANYKKGGPLWATPDKVAADIERAVAKGKRVVYTPWFWWPIMFIIGHLPWFVFKRLKI